MEPSHVQSLLTRMQAANLQHQAEIAAALSLFEALGTKTYRPTTNLNLALIQAQKTRAQVAHLTAIPEPRLVALAAGVEPTDDERHLLQRVLGHTWRG